MQRPDQVGREHEAALEDGDDQEIARRRLGDGLGKLLVTSGDRLLVEEHADPAWKPHGENAISLTHGRDGRAVACRGEANQNLPALGRGRSEPGAEARRFAGPQCPPWRFVRPGVKRFLAGPLHRQDERGDVEFASGRVLDLAFDDQTVS
jgi:hypothetical protein